MADTYFSNVRIRVANAKSPYINVLCINFIELQNICVECTYIKHIGTKNINTSVVNKADF